MNIYIDESGTFVNASGSGKWNAVGALVVTESNWKKLDAIVKKLIRGAAGRFAQEIKLKHIQEETYFNFLSELEELNALLFCIATDAGLNTDASVAEHQQFQVCGVLENVGRMKYEGGRTAVESLATQIRALSPQLYVQLMCQINLMHEVVSRSVTYFAQHTPSTLGHFKWSVDQKNSERPRFEETFERLWPALLQSRSIQEPLIMVEGFDYSHMKRYGYPNYKPPDYLKEEYGVDVKEALDLQKMVRGNMKFVDSKTSTGVQAIDLVVSGIRRCLRGEFSDNDLAAKRLGRLMLQARHNAPPLGLVAFGAEAPLPESTSRLVKLMIANCRPMIKKTFSKRRVSDRGDS